MSEKKPTAKMRHCWNCGASLGVIESRLYESRLYDSGDTCGAPECEARYEREAERAEAHEQLDRDMGW